MCVAVPVQVLAIEGQEAEVELSGVRRRVSVVLTPEVQVGQYVLLHTGFAIGVLDDQEAQETLAMFDQIAAGTEGAVSETPHDVRP